MISIGQEKKGDLFAPDGSYSSSGDAVCARTFAWRTFQSWGSQSRGIRPDIHLPPRAGDGTFGLPPFLVGLRGRLSLDQTAGLETLYNGASEAFRFFAQSLNRKARRQARAANVA